jgi:hypothetical protein
MKWMPDDLQRKLAILLLAVMAIPVGSACYCLVLYGLPARAIAVAKEPGFHAVGATELSRAHGDSFGVGVFRISMGGVGTTSAVASGRLRSWLLRWGGQPRAGPRRRKADPAWSIM